MYKYINKHSLLMLENKNLNSIKIIDEGWGELGDKKSGGRGAGKQLFCFKNKNLVSYIFVYVYDNYSILSWCPKIYRQVSKYY